MCEPQRPHAVHFTQFATRRECVESMNLTSGREKTLHVLISNLTTSHIGNWVYTRISTFFTSKSFSFCISFMNFFLFYWEKLENLHVVLKLLYNPVLFIFLSFSIFGVYDNHLVKRWWTKKISDLIDCLTDRIQGSDFLTLRR